MSNVTEDRYGLEMGLRYGLEMGSRHGLEMGDYPMPNITEGMEMGNAARIWSLHDADIGGAFVRRGFSSGGTFLKAGTRLTAQEVRSIPMVNRRALAVSGALDVYPLMRPAAEDLARFVIHRGAGMYDVIEGRKLTDEPIARADAEAMAAAVAS